MRKLPVLLLLFFGLIQSIFAQVNVIGDPLVTDFPNIEFTIHNRNPEVVDESAFTFSELINSNKSIMFSVVIFTGLLSKCFLSN